jgi:hypothetical protein
MAEEKDILEKAETLLAESNICHNVSVTQAIEKYSLESGFPQVCLLDAGDEVKEGVSEDLETENIFLAAYADFIGDGREGVLEVKRLIKKARAILEAPENFYSNGPFSGYNSCRYKGSQNAQNLRIEKEEQFIVVRIATFGFTKQVSNV